MYTGLEYYRPNACLASISMPTQPAIASSLCNLGLQVSHFLTPSPSACLLWTKFDVLTSAKQLCNMAQCTSGIPLQHLKSIKGGLPMPMPPSLPIRCACWSRARAVCFSARPVPFETLSFLKAFGGPSPLQAEGEHCRLLQPRSRCCMRLGGEQAPV